jgi:hypothetical protein
LTTTHLFSKTVIHKIKSADQAIIFQPIHVGQTNKQNELIFFIKPELLNIDDDAKIFNILKMIEEKFNVFDITVHGAAILPGGTLEKHGIMNRHYGFINQLSRKASEIIDAETRDQLFEILGLPDAGDHRILGGHEFLKAYDTNLATLSDLWFKKEAKKLRSGFYFCEDTFQGEPVILVNGFHPSQLQHFTKKDHRILVMLLHTDTDWHAMKFDLVGDTFPERANPSSMRGLLYADPGFYGLNEVGINKNGVHLSAGPFEAAFEVVNFFGALLNLDPRKTPPLAVERAISAGLSRDQALALLENPGMNESDLFSETENLNTEAAVRIANGIQS